MPKTASPPTPRKKKRARLRLNLHPGQREVYESDARFRVVACGRQWGKSRLASAIAFETALKGGKVWWIAPDLNVADVGWDLLKKLAFQIPDIEVNETRKTLRVPGGGWIQLKGAHLPGKLRGRTLDLVIIDEAAFIPTADRWNSELRPTLAINQGKALFTSTFDGENWFYDLYQLGQDEAVEEWESWRFVSTTNPYFSDEELEHARATTPEAEFEQEYMANPLAYVGAVFPGEKVQAAADRGRAPVWPEPSGQHDSSAEVFAGLDWGYTNATAFEVCREYPASGRVRWFDERLWVATQLETRVARIVELCGEHGIEEIYADAAGASENAALSAALDDAGLPTGLIRVGFGTKLKSGETAKDAGIKTRRWYLEQGLEDLSPDCPELIRTTKRYRYKENSEDVLKEDDHPVDAATAFYASRRGMLVEDRNKRSA